MICRAVRQEDIMCNSSAIFNIEAPEKLIEGLLIGFDDVDKPYVQEE
jgi:hypothetical protein